MISYLLKFLIVRYDVICFDIFDTLIERTVNKPSDIFRLAGEEVLGKEKVEDFCRERKAAEKIARLKKITGEVTLDEIYEQINSFYTESKEKLKYSEIKWELKSCVVKEKLQKIFQYAIQNNKEVYLISDMYLPYKVIEKMLCDCAITGYKKLYISNEYNKNKLTGNLFKLVIQENFLINKRILHIGDSFRADYLGAKRVGIHSVLVKRKKYLGRLIDK